MIKTEEAGHPTEVLVMSIPHGIRKPAASVIDLPCPSIRKHFNTCRRAAV
jgi:hypothetical protein